MQLVGGKSISHYRTKTQLSLLSPSFSSQPVQGGKLPRSLKLSGGIRVFRSLLHKRQLAFHHLSGKYSLNSESVQISDIKSEILIKVPHLKSNQTLLPWASWGLESWEGAR